MSSVSIPVPIQGEGDPESRRGGMRWSWPAGARGVLAVAVIAGALGLAFASKSVPESAAEIVRAPDLLLDLIECVDRSLKLLRLLLKLLAPLLKS